VRQIFGLMLGAWLLGTLPAAGDTLYGADGAQATPSHLYVLDPASGAVTATVGEIGFAVTGLAIHPITGVMYGSTGNAGPTNPKSLVVIDKATGKGTLVGPFIFDPDVDAQTMTDLAFTSDGTLYGLGSSDGNLYTVDPATGAATPVGESGIRTPVGGALAADACDTLFVSTGSDAGTLDTVDGVTGEGFTGPELPGTLGIPLSAMAFNSTGILYASVLDNTETPATAVLATVDQQTGALVTLGPTVDRLDAIAFDFPHAAPDPTPPSISLSVTIAPHAVAPGTPARVVLAGANGGRAAAVDLYFAAQVPPALSAAFGCPNGDGIVFLSDAFASMPVPCTATDPFEDFEPLYRNVCFAANQQSTALTPAPFDFEWPAGLPAGTYTLFLAATPPRAFAQGLFEITTFALDTFDASP
jgi:hypothetical protein